MNDDLPSNNEEGLAVEPDGVTVEVTIERTN